MRICMGYIMLSLGISELTKYGILNSGWRDGLALLSLSLILIMVGANLLDPVDK